MLQLNNIIVKIHRGSTKDWNETLYIPLEGEPVFDYEKNILKIGNGIDKFNDLLPIGIPLINKCEGSQ